MAIGDRIATELVGPTALSATATTVFTNTSASYRTQLLEIWLCNTVSTQRTVTFFKNGLFIGNRIADSIVLAGNTSIVVPTKLVTTGTQIFGAKQDTGTDVNILINGIVEQIA